MEDAYNLYGSELLYRESSGDSELMDMIVQRELALEDFLERRHSVTNEKELLDVYLATALAVREMKSEKGIVDPAHTLESRN